MATGDDRKMNNFVLATDAEYMYIELADGSQGKMRKADFMELIRSLILPVTKRLLLSYIPNYGFTLTHKIHANGCVRFDIIQNYFGSGTSSINAVCISVMAELGFNSTPRVKVTTTGGMSHPMDNKGCSIAYKIESETLFLYSPSNSSYPLTVIEFFSNGQVELVLESYESVSNLTLIPMSGN